MARFRIQWTESVDYSGYIDVDDCATVRELHDKIRNTDFNWYPRGDTEAMDSEVTKLPWYIKRMED